MDQGKIGDVESETRVVGTLTPDKLANTQIWPHLEDAQGVQDLGCLPGGEPHRMVHSIKGKRLGIWESAGGRKREGVRSRRGGIGSNEKGKDPMDAINGGWQCCGGHTSGDTIL